MFWDQKWGLEKHGFVEEWFPNWRLWGFPRPEWIVWYPGGLWESQFPQNPFKKLFPLTCLYLGKFGEGPPGPPVYPLWALCGSEGLAILSTYLVEPLLL